MIPWAHPSAQPKLHLDRCSRFCQMTVECPYTLQQDVPSPKKLQLPMVGSGPLSNAWFPGPTRVFNPNGISIGSAIFAGFSSVTDRPRYLEEGTMEEGTKGLLLLGPLLHAKFHPHRCNDKGVGPPKLKFLLRFDRNVEYKRPTGAYPLRDFHKICRVSTSFQDPLGVKIWLDLLKGLWGYGDFKLRGSCFPRIFSAP